MTVGFLDQGFCRLYLLPLLLGLWLPLAAFGQPKALSESSDEQGRLVTGFNHACTLATGGTVKCWGSNKAGQLGNDSTTPSATPVDVFELSGASALSAGIAHSCELVDGSVRCWGENTLG